MIQFVLAARRLATLVDKPGGPLKKNRGTSQPSLQGRTSARPRASYLKEAFNQACEQYAGDSRQEEIAHRAAWAAVKKGYLKLGANVRPR
jgi:hypothetical protein